MVHSSPLNGYIFLHITDCQAIIGKPFMGKTAKYSIEKEHLLTIRDLIQNRTGLFFPESKFFALDKPISDNFQDSPSTTISEYTRFLQSENGKPLFKKLISLLTTNETFFFREKAHFELIRKILLPGLIAKESSGTRSLAIWSAGCSTGEEPYSIAILLRELIPQIETWKIHLIASDIDPGTLYTAQEGIYNQWSFRGVDPDIIKKCFHKIGDEYSIKKEYKSLVRFMSHNLISDPPPNPGNQDKYFDLIICRNVTIYFTKETTTALASKFYHCLKDGGYLIVGHSEHSAENYALFKSRAFPDTIVYQKSTEEKPEQDSIFGPIKGEGLVSQFASGKIRALHGTVKKIRKKLPDTGKSEIPGRRDAANKEETIIFDTAIQYYKEKKYDLSVDRFLRILAINPPNARACWMLSHISANRGDFENAMAWGERCLKIDSLFQEVYYTLALAFMAQGNFEKAEEKLKEAIYIDQNFALAYFTLGNLYVSKRLYPQAKKCFNTAVDILTSRPMDETVSQTEKLTVRELLNIIESKVTVA